MSLLKSVLAAVFVLPIAAVESAWNGYVSPGTNSTVPFFPYYVPSTGKSYDDLHPSFIFSPANAWRVAHSPQYAHNTLHFTTRENASVIFRFHGHSVELFGTVGTKHGIANVLLDEKVVARVNMFNFRNMNQQRLFSKSSLPPGSHTLKLINTGKKERRSSGTLLGIDVVLVIPYPDQSGTSSRSKPPANVIPSPPNLARSRTTESLGWTLVQKGTTGVHAMQLSIISERHAIIMDKVEHNPLTIDGHPAWGALYDLSSHEVHPLHVRSNSFCAGGTFLSNGTLINVGGNPIVESRTGAADFGDVNGMQSIRIFEPCSMNIKSCDIYDDPRRIRMASPRWYNTVVRISDGSAMIIGGSKRGGWMNNRTTNNPTLEFFPPKNIHGYKGLPIPFSFLSETLNANLFPIAFVLPDERVFIAANNDATIYDWRKNTERRLPPIPNGVRVTYPMTGTALLLPLTPARNYLPEILVCGGSALDDTKPGYELTSQDPSSDQCARIALTEDGIEKGWEVERMPHARVMPDAVLLPDGKVIIVNGAETGIAGYGNVKDRVGQSNADNPVLQPVIYDPMAGPGSRFSSDGLPFSHIPRLYHSVATLTPLGDIMIAGSNPNLDRSETKYRTEYRVEWLRPPYIQMTRPRFVGDLPKSIGFGVRFDVEINLGSGSSQQVSISLMDLGYVTHAVHANSRMVILASKLSDSRKILTITGPPSPGIYPPGPGFLFLVVGDIPSIARKVMIGDGKMPPADDDAFENLWRSTSPAE